MTIEQTVEIPLDHRLILEIPREIPAGKAKLTFTPILAANEDVSGEDIDQESQAIAHEFVKQHIVAFRELAK